MAIDGIDLKLLRLFIEVVKAGGFSAAQSSLNLSLATISGHVAALEARLGLVLCRRGRAGFQLTADGQAVFEQAQALMARLDQFDRQLRDRRSTLTGTLTVGLTDNTISDPASPVETTLARFTDMAPGVTLALVTRPPHELLRDLLAGELHVALASFPRQAPGLSYIDLYAEAQNVYCGNLHPLFGRDVSQIDATALREYRIVGRTYWGARDLKVFAIAAASAMVGDMEAEARLILSGRYLGYLPDHYARRFVVEGRMRCLRPDLFGYNASFQAAYDPVRRVGAVSLFLDILGSEQAALLAAAGV